MSGNAFGNRLTVTLFGESHGAAIGCVIDGLAPGLSFDWDEVRREMKRRAPGQNSMSTPRKEADAFEIVSGYFDDHTTGTPLTAIIRNTNQHSRDYGEMKYKMRPGHADYSGYIKYGGFGDYRGGGHFSGRITAPLVFAGALARQVLRKEGITIGSHILSIGSVKDRPFSPMGETKEVLEGLTHEVLPVLEKDRADVMKKEILSAAGEKDSVGGIIECMAVGIPSGWGDPFFDSVESVLSHLLFSVPAVKGVAFGDGFAMAGARGSEMNDAMRMKDGHVTTTSNHNGGILGGITNGMPIRFTAAIKPTASIGKEQQTVNMSTMTNTSISVGGRHDPCIVPRAVPVIEAVMALGLLMIQEDDSVYGK
jgi:chorismate synthase